MKPILGRFRRRKSRSERAREALDETVQSLGKKVEAVREAVTVPDLAPRAQAPDRAKEALTTLRESATTIVERAGEKLHEAEERLAEKSSDTLNGSGKSAAAALDQSASAVAEKAADAKDSVAEKAADAKDSVAEKAADAKDSVAEALGGTTSAAAEKAVAAKEGLQDLLGKSREAVGDGASQARESVTDHAGAAKESAGEAAGHSREIAMAALAALAANWDEIAPLLEERLRGREEDGEKAKKKTKKEPKYEGDLEAPRDASGRSYGFWLWLLRLAVGASFIESLRGRDLGAYVDHEAKEIMERQAASHPFGWYRDLLQQKLIPHARTVGAATVAAEGLAALGAISGLNRRPAGLLGLTVTSNRLVGDYAKHDARGSNLIALIAQMLLLRTGG